MPEPDPGPDVTAPPPAEAAPWQRGVGTWAPPAGQPFAGAQPSTDGFAIASLVFGVIGGMLFSFVFGLVGLRRTRHGLKRGRGLAITGLVLSGVWLLVIVAAIAYAAGREPTRGDAGAITQSGALTYDALRVGDCAELPRITPARVTTVPVVPCSELHNAQVVAIVESTLPAYPGDAEMRTAALADCRTAGAPSLGANAAGFHYVAYFPTHAQWDKGTRREECLLVDRRADFTGDIHART